MELSWDITSVTEADYDGVNETVKRVVPIFDGVKTGHIFIRPDAETDAAAKTAVKAVLTDKGYTWTSEV